MEKEPDKKPDMFLEIGNNMLHCTPENTFGYLYEDNRFDHLFFVTQHNDDGTMSGYHIWRRMFGEKFDEAIYHMIDTGYDVESLTEPDENDRNTFFSKYKDEPAELPQLLQPTELTPRQDNYVANYGKFLQYITVTAEDFM